MPDSPARLDLRERDDTIAVNSCTTVLGRRGVPEERLRACWRDAHGPLCARIPGLGFSVQHHFTRTRDAHLWPPMDGVTPLDGYVLDGAVEIGWDSAQSQQRFQQASGILLGDEQNVFEKTAAYPLPSRSRSTTVFDREVDPVRNGRDRYDRMHVHLTPRDGAAEALADPVRSDLAQALAAEPGSIEARVHAPEDHDNSTPNVAHTVQPERVRLVVLELVHTDPIARRRP